MKIPIRYLFLVFLLPYASNLHSQSQVALEQIQIYSTTQPKLNYWHLPEDIGFIERALDTGLFAKLNLQRVTQPKTIKSVLTKQSQVGKISINWEQTRSTPFHAYLEIYELEPNFAYQNKIIDIVEDRVDSLQSVWVIACTVFNQNRDRIYQKTIAMGMTPMQSFGMGYPIWSTTPFALFQAIGKGVGILEPELDDITYIDTKVPFAYATDNYWMPLIHNKPRISIDTNKQFFSYSSSNELQLLRIPTAMLNKIDLKNKGTNYRYKQTIDQIKKYRTGLSGKEFYEVIQPLRNVKANKDYTLNAFLEFNPYAAENNSFISQQALQFMPNFSHTIYEGKDSIGQFSVQEKVWEEGKYYNMDVLYNGYDTTKQYKVGTSNGPEKIIHSKVIMGSIYKHPFAIQISADNRQKTILLDDKIVMIVEGANKPHQMVNMANDIPLDVKNLLLLMAYGEIFQSPN
jgi:hypothetical protein